MTRETRTWKSLYGSDRWTDGPAILQKHNPDLLWDKLYHSLPPFFFQNALGLYRAHPSGSYYRAQYEDTNMMLCGQLGVPLIFEARQIRFYPGTTDQGMVEKWKDRKWCASRLTARASTRLKLTSHDHLPLPEIDNFTKEEQRQGRIDLMARAKTLFDVVNGGKLPCVVADIDMTFYGVDYLAFNLHSDEKAIDPMLSTYAVLVGSIWISS